MKIAHALKAAGLAAALTLLAAGASVSLAEEAHIYLAPYGFSGNLGGEGQVANGGNGSAFDLEDTFGLDPSESLRGIDGFLHLAMFQFSFGYQENSYGGSTTLSSDLDFDGSTFPTGEKVETQFDFKHYKAMLGMQFGLPMVSVGFIGGVHQIDVTSEVQSRTTNSLNEQQDFSIPVPAIGVTVGVHPLKQLSIHGEASGMSAHVSGIEERMLDSYASLEYLFLGGKFGLMAGYRYFSLEAKEDDKDNHVNMKMHGPYAGLVLHL